MILAAHVCKLLKPVEVSEENQPSQDSPEALIMQSDLLSGGLENHLYCILDESDLSQMLQDAEISCMKNHQKESNGIVTTLREALSNQAKSLETDVLNEQDRLLRKVMGEIPESTD